jgi:methionyl-tRNA formyltransferase
MQNGKLRIIFMGTPDFIVPVLCALAESGHELVCVYTQPPRPKGRGGTMQKSAANKWAEEKGIEVRIPADFRDSQTVVALRGLEADAIIVAAYGMLLPEDVLSVPRHGCLNIHPSLLPRWRGTSPVQFAIQAGDEETGVSIMRLVRKMDAGPILAQERITIPPRATYESLNAQLWDMSINPLLDILNRLARGEDVPGRPQPPQGVTYTKMFTKTDGKIDWTRNAAVIDRQVRALHPWPGVWSLLGDKNMKVLEAVPAGRYPGGGAPGQVLDRQGHVACGEDTVLQILKIQPAGVRLMDFPAAINGGHIREGDQFV